MWLSRLLVVLIVVAAMVPFGARGAHAAAPTIVSLTFDDGQSSQASVAPVLAAQNVRARWLAPRRFQNRSSMPPEVISPFEPS